MQYTRENSPKSDVRCPMSGKKTSDFFRIFGLLGLLLSNYSVLAQYKTTDTLPSFQFDVLSFQTAKFSPDSARVDVFVAVPYSWLMFLNATEKYVADYEVKVTISEKPTDSLVRSRVQPLSVTLATAEWEKLHELDMTRA